MYSTLVQPDDSAFAAKSEGSTGKSPQLQKRVFISYAREDQGFAERLYGDLRGRGVSAWMDTKDLLPGENWKEAIRRAIRSSAYVLALLSPRAVSKRGFVQSEFRFAQEILKEAPRTEIFLIPALLEVCEPTDELFNELHWADFTSSYEAGLNQLLRVLAPPTTVPDAAARVPSKVWY